MVLYLSCNGTQYVFCKITASPLKFHESLPDLQTRSPLYKLSITCWLGAPRYAAAPTYAHRRYHLRLPGIFRYIGLACAALLWILPRKLFVAIYFLTSQRRAGFSGTNYIAYRFLYRLLISYNYMQSCLRDQASICKEGSLVI